MPWPLNNIKHPLTLVLLLLGVGVVALYVILDPSDYSVFPKCPIYATTGIYCPGCGSQRAIHNILNGQLIAGFKYNWLVLLTFLVLSYQAFMYITKHVFKKEYTNVLHMSKVTKGILMIVLLFWIFRNIKAYPFNLLAP